MLILVGQGSWVLFNLYLHFTGVIGYEIPLDFELIQNKVLI